MYALQCSTIQYNTMHYSNVCITRLVKLSHQKNESDQWVKWRQQRETVPTLTVLYCTDCTVLYCTVLYCTVLYCTVLYCTVLYCTVLYCTINMVQFRPFILHYSGNCNEHRAGWTLTYCTTLREMYCNVL